MKRVYTRVETRELDGARGDHHWGIALDDRAMRTPGKNELRLPSAALASAIAAEWDAQQGDIRPATMPLFRLAATAIDRTATERDLVVAETASYAGTDLLCYRVDHPPALAALQHAAWQPLIDWAALRYDARLAVTTGIIPAAQSPAALRAFAAAVAARDDFHLTALRTLTAASGSLVIALALAEGHLDAEAAFAAAQLDETFQVETWGEDAEAAARRQALAADIAAAARFIALLADP